MITIRQAGSEHIAQLVEHQRCCFPTVGEADLFNAENFAAHIRLFPEGQHVALDGDRLVGESSTFRISGAKIFVPHTFHEIVGAGFFTLHDPQGDWLYGADMSVHPAYRGRRIASQLYDVRKELIRRLGLCGMAGGGMLPGFPRYSHMLDVERYVAEVVAGRLVDPTLTPQLRNGFRVHAVYHNHLPAGELGSDAALIVWENPAYGR